jgi:hypothetical protein
LGYLQRFKVDQIKIDPSFVQELDTAGRRGSALLSAVVTLARALDVQVVAEGVETESQFRTLSELACDQMQGFLLSRPLPAADFLIFMRSAAKDESGRTSSGSARLTSQPSAMIEIAGAIIFRLALADTFLAKRFAGLARHHPGHAGLFHFLGEAEVLFGFWAFPAACDHRSRRPA